MKAMQGLIIAVLFGGAAVVLNWIYLDKKAKEFQVESFLGIRDGVKIRIGQTLEEKDFEPVPVPMRYAERLKKFVFLYRDKGTVAGIKATRDYRGGDLVHREDYKTPARELKLKPDERMIWVTVDSRSFVPALVNPGDQITFIFPSPPLGGGAEQPSSTSESIGPFIIGALGTRLGDVNVSRGYSATRAQERQVGIIVRVEGGKLEPKAMRLLELTTGSSRSVAVALHPRKEKD